LAHIKKEFEETNLTHTRALEEANRKHARELAEVKEGWKKAKETHEREIFEAQYAMLKGQSIALVSH
jgi:phosphoenolpyruvate-protein kinase (PTS system EI component)